MHVTDWSDEYAQELQDDLKQGCSYSWKWPERTDSIRMLLDARARIAELEAQMQPQPWPPPDDNEDLSLILAFDPLMKEWRSIECFPNDDWESVNEEEGPFSHYLSMPPAPREEGQG